jgi:hypothetical protein
VEDGFRNSPRIWDKSDEGVGVGSGNVTALCESRPDEGEFATGSLTRVGNPRLGPRGLFHNFVTTNTRVIPPIRVTSIKKEIRYFFLIFIIYHPILHKFPSINFPKFQGNYPLN